MAVEQVQALRANFTCGKVKMPAQILVAVLHETLNARHFDTLADLIDELKSEAARLRIPYTAESIAAAVQAVGQSRQLVWKRA